MKCPECANNTLQQQEHELFCTSCGLIIDDAPVRHEQAHIDHSEHPLVAEAGTFEYRGKIVTARYLLTTRQRNLHATKALIELIGERHKLPSRVRTEAFLLFTQASNKELTHTRGNNDFAYACVYAACLLHDIPKTPLEMTAFTDVSRVKMLQAYRIIKRALQVRTRAMRSSDFVHRFGSRLELSAPIITRAMELIETQQHAVASPSSIAAAALYVAAKEGGEERTQRQVANSTGVIEVTIRKHTKLLKKY